MTKSDYEVVAEIIHRLNVTIDAEFKLIHELAYTFAGALGADNPLLDRGWFIEACEKGVG